MEEKLGILRAGMPDRFAFVKGRDYGPLYWHRYDHGGMAGSGSWTGPRGPRTDSLVGRAASISLENDGKIIFKEYFVFLHHAMEADINIFLLPLPCSSVVLYRGISLHVHPYPPLDIVTFCQALRG